MSDKPKGFDALIEAFTIFKKYDNPVWPTNCEHDVMRVCIDANTVSAEDKARLKVLGFFVSSMDGTFISFQFGSA